MVTSSKDIRTLDGKVSLAEAPVFGCRHNNTLTWRVLYSTVGGEGCPEVLGNPSSVLNCPETLERPLHLLGPQLPIC